MRAEAARLTSSDRPWDEPITKTTSPAPLAALPASRAASSSLDTSLPSTHRATRLCPRRTWDRIALPSFSRARATSAGEAFFSSIFSSGSSMILKLAKADSRLAYSATPSAQYLAFSLPRQIRSMVCINASLQQGGLFGDVVPPQQRAQRRQGAHPVAVGVGQVQPGRQADRGDGLVLFQS